MLQCEVGHGFEVAEFVAGVEAGAGDFVAVNG